MVIKNLLNEELLAIDLVCYDDDLKIRLTVFYDGYFKKEYFVDLDIFMGL